MEFKSFESSDYISVGGYDTPNLNSHELTNYPTTQQPTHTGRRQQFQTETN
jgi:hypothetical protein